jgi:hypothetical protein
MPKVPKALAAVRRNPNDLTFSELDGLSVRNGNCGDLSVRFPAFP